MSLNDNVLDGLDEHTAIDEDIVHSPNNSNHVVNKSIELDQVAKEAYDEIGSHLHPLSDMSVKLHAVNSDITKIDELNEVRSDIIATEAINRVTASYADDIFDGVITQKIAIEEFTNNLSKTNFQYAVKCMDNKIRISKTASLESVNDFLTTSLSDSASISTRIMSVYKDTVKSMFDDLSFNCRDIIAQFEDNKNYILPFEGEFINIVKTNLDLLDFNKLSFQDNANHDMANIIKFMNNIKELLKCPLLKAFICTIINGGHLSGVNSESILNYQDEALSLLQIARFVTSSSLEDAINDIANAAEEDIKQTTKLTEQHLAGKDSYEQTSVFVRDHTECLSSLFHGNHKLCTILSGTSQLLANCAPLFCLLRKF